MNFSGFDLSTIQDVYVGGTGFSYIYYGSNLVWQKSAPYDEQYFTMEALEDGTFGFTKGVNQPAVYYSTDNGATWTEFPRNTSISVNTGDKVLYKRDASGASTLSGYNMKLSSTCNFKVYGNVQSLIYSDNFINTTDLKNKAWVLAQLLMNNDKLIDAQNLILPATTITNNGYRQMFSGCTSLTTAPALPATTINDTSYGWVFAGCTSLTTPPVMPTSSVSVSGSYSYKGMFSGCTSLTTAPALPATTVGTQTYQEMFKGCTSLTTAPALPATTLGSNCYYEMFRDCTSLTTAPDLNVATLVSNCYNSMFYGCSLLNYIKCLATDISATDCTTNWVQGVAASGTFVKDYDMTDWTIGNNGIPTGWSVQNTGEYYDQYLTIESLEDNNDIYFRATGITTPTQKEIFISKNDGVTWTRKVSSTSSPGTLLATLNTGEKILIKGSNSAYGGGQDHITYYNCFNPCEDVKIYGNVMSLIYGDNYKNQYTLTTEYALGHLFFGSARLDVEHLVLPATTLSRGCYESMFSFTDVINAPKLPATTLAEQCYYEMFSYCYHLTTPPALPATTLAPHCYDSMFIYCQALNSAPALPATTLTTYCYRDMFEGCTSLTTAPVLQATTLTQSCYWGMFIGCTALTSAPELPATTLTRSCYGSMFKNCSSLNYIKCSAIDISANFCLDEWVDGVASSGDFYKNSSTTYTRDKNGIPSGWTIHNI